MLEDLRDESYKLGYRHLPVTARSATPSFAKRPIMRCLEPHRSSSGYSEFAGFQAGCRLRFPPPILLLI